MAHGDADALREALRDIATDEAMPVAERQARLEALAEAYGLLPGEMTTDPLQAQIAQALSLLSTGGHGQRR